VKIALVRSAVHRQGGVERYVWLLARELAGRGHEVHLLARRCPELPHASVRFRPVEARGLFSFQKVLGFAAGVREILAQESFDVVHSCDRVFACDIYRAGEFPLAGDLTASSFAKLARADCASAPRRQDLAAALMGLVGENVALICGGLAAAAQVPRVLYAGSTLRDNPALCGVIAVVTSALGRTPVFPEHGEFAGAVGALRLATSP